MYIPKLQPCTHPGYAVNPAKFFSKRLFSGRVKKRNWFDQFQVFSKAVLPIIILMLLGNYQLQAQCTANGAGNQFPFGSVNAGTGDLVTIANNSWEGEYSRINNINNGTTYRFTISEPTDIITVRIGNRNGAILGFGTGSVIVTATANSNLFVHWNTSTCGTDNVNRVTTVQAAPQINSLGATSGCVGNTITINGDNLSNATPANVLIGGTPVTAIVSNTATQIVATIGAGTTGVVTVSNDAGSDVSASVFTVNTLPNLYNVSGGGSFCAGGAGLAVGLSGSEIGVNYQLYNGATPVGGAIAGTGAVINFGTQTTGGTYTVIATRTSTGCSSTMTGSAVVTVNPLPQVSVFSGNTVCTAGTGQLTVVTSSGTGPFTVIYDDGVGNRTALGVSSGTPFNAFINPLATTNYSLVSITDNNGCFRNSGFTDASAAITVGATPLNRAPSAVAATICSGTATNIQVPTSQPGYNYQLRNDAGNVNIGAAVAGTGGTINLPTGTLAATTTFNVLATQVSSGCNAEMTPLVTVTVNAAATVTPGATINTCQAVSPSAITLAGASIGGGATTGAWSITAGLGTLSSTAQTATPGTVTYTAPSNYNGTVVLTLTTNDPAGPCGLVSATRTINVGALPTVTITANYCIGGGAVRLTSSLQTSYLWSTGATTQFIDVTAAGNYSVTGTNAAGCSANATFAVAQELVVNGNFSAGNTGFTTLYSYQTTANSLTPAATYGVGPSANFYHTNFWGTDHTSGSGNFMIVNGSSATQEIWEEIVTVTPNTTYYFSAWAMSLNNVSPYAQLQFSVNGTAIGTTATLAAGATSNSGPFNWVRFYGSWNSGSNTTATINVIDLQTAAGGNDFGLDDISFSTLSPVSMTVAPTATATLCEGGTINLTANLTGGASPFTYAWTGPASYSSSSVNPSITGAVPANSGVYNLSVLDGNGCNATASTAAVTVNALPTDITPTAPATVCSGSSANVQIPGSQAGVRYQLRDNATNTNIGASVNGTGGAINLPTGAMTASTTFNVLVTNNTTSCSIQLTNTVSITVNALPTVSITGATSICVGLTTTLSPVTGGTWASSNNALATVTNAGVVTGVAAGSPTFTFTQTSTGCSRTTASITVNALPTVTAPASVCVGSTAILSPTTGGTWVSSNNSLATVTNAGVVTGVAPGSVTFTFTQTSTGCSRTTSAVTINALPTVSITGATAICVGATTTLSPVTGGTWASSNAGRATVTNAGVVTGVSAGAVTFTFTQTSTGCSRTTASITVNALPAVTAPASICVGNTAILSPTTGGTWLSSNNSFATVTNAGVVTAVAPGSVTFTFTQTSTGCSRTTSAVTINALPTVSITGATTICAGSTTTLSPATGGTWASSNNAIATVTNAGVVTGVSAGSPTFTFTQTSTGCSRTTGAITVNALPTNVTASAASSNICPGTSTNIVIASSQVGVNYQLRDNAGNTLVGSAVAGTGGNINLPTGTLSSTTTFNVLATITSSGCNIQLSSLVTVSMDNVAPVITCPATQSVNLDAACTGVVPDYTSLAVVTDNCTPTGSITVIQSPAAGAALSGTGSFTVTLTATDALGNSSNCNFTVNKLDVTAPVITCPADIVVDAAAGSCGAIVNYTINSTDNCSGFCAPASIPGYTLIGTLSGHTYFRSNGSTNWATANANANALGAHLVTISSAAENTFLNAIGVHWTGMTDQATEGTWAWINGEPVTYTSWNGGEPNNSGGNEDHMHINYGVAGGWNDINGGANYPAIIEFDCISTTLTTGYSSGSLFPIGTTTVTHTATDAAGNSSTCSFDVTVNDVTAPTISCPANITINTLPGECTAIVNYNAPMVTDNCGTCVTAPAITGYTSLGTFGGFAYYISNATMTPPAAFTAAAGQGGQVATINDATENTFVRNAANAAGFTGNYFIGVNDVAVEGTFVGGSNESLTYFNWNGGEPNNMGNEDYVQIYAAGVWNDIGATATGNFIMKVSCITPVRTSGLASGSSFPLGVSTIDYSGTDASGNTSTCSFTVTVSLNPTSIGKTVTATPATICSGSSSNITVALSESGISYQLRNNATNINVGSPVIGTGGTISLPTGALTATTTFNILATNTGNGCSYQLTNTATVTVNALPTVSITGATTICAGSTTTLLPTTGGTWASSNNAIATVTNAGVVTGVSAGSATFTFTQTSTGCSSTTASVTVNALPIVTAPASVCVGSTAILSPITGGTWLSSNNAIATVTNAGVITGVAAGSVTFTFTQTSTGCSRTTAAVTINALPTVSITGATAICVGSTTTLSPISSGTWVSSNTGIATVTNAGVITGVAAGSATFTYTQTSTGCNNTTSSITVNALPAVTAPASVCVGSTATLSPITGGTWASSNAGVATVTNAGVVTGIAPGSVTFTFTQTSTGCSNTTSSVTINALPSAPTAGNNSRCGTGTVVITATPGAGETIDWYAASTGGAPLSSGSNTYTTPSIAITTTYYAQARNTTTGCFSATRTAVTATVNSLPLISAQSTAAATYCLNAASTAFSVTASGTSITYQWYVNTVASNVGGSAIAGATSNTYAPSTATVSTLYYYCLVSGTCTPAVRTAISGAINVTGTTTSFNTSGTFTYTVPAGITEINVNTWGAGGGGSKGYSGLKGTGGGGGGFAQGTLSVTPGDIINITVGDGGLGATASGNGTAGGSTIVTYGATTLTATGGGGGVSTIVPSGNGGVSGTGSGGSLSFLGGTGADIFVPAAVSPGGGGGASAGILNNGFNAGNTIPGSSQSGGSAVLQAGAGGVGGTGNGSGAVGGFPGGGGGGNAGTGFGGNGADGRVIISIPLAITYASAAYCNTVTSAAVTVSGTTGGTFTSSPAGLTINGSTGTINPSTSTIGTYTVTYTNSCATANTTVTINGAAVPTAVNNSRCGTGTVTIGAVPGAGETIDWYSAPTGGTLLLSGNTSYTTPSIAATTTYYAQARNTTTGCVSTTRRAVIATVNALPVNRTVTVTPATTCAGTGVNVRVATSQVGISYQLRDDATDTNIGTPVNGTGGNINLPTGALSSTTAFNVLATNNTTLCTNQMTNVVTVTVNPSGQWIGGATGNWNTSSNWCGGIPSSSTDVIIPAGVTVNIQTADATASSVTIDGSLVMTGAYDLSISSGGSITNNGTFNAGASTGTVAFLGNGTISGTTTFKNVDTYGALDFGTASTIGGTFIIQTGGSVTGNAPFYTCPTATLLYNAGGTYLRGLEWTTNSSGAGCPANVTIQNNTVINFPVVGQGYICNDLQIQNGSSLRQDHSGGSAILRVGRNITINGTLSLGGSNGGDLYLGGSWTRSSSGVFNHNDRKVIFDGPANFSGNGTAMSTISAPASAAKDNEGGFGGENFAHLWINKTNATDSVVLLSNVTVNREIGFTSGTFSLRNSDVTLVSNLTRTADVAPITNTANVNLRYAGSGRFAIQRYVHNPTGTRSWRLITAPLEAASAPTINQAYQEGVVNPNRSTPNGSGGIYNPWPGYGTHITGVGGAYSFANGFDHGTSSASMLYAGPGVLTWPNVASTKSVKVTDQPGWMLFVRGDRSFVIGNQYYASQDAVLEPKGKINAGDVVKPIVAGKQVMGNPYASSISLLNVDVAGTAGGDATYYMWDPKMYTSYTQPGKWVTFTGIGSSYVQTTSQSAYTSDGTIESGMAFVIDAPSAGNITFHETDKLPLSSSLVGNTSGVSARPAAPLTVPLFRADIYAANAGKYTLTDGVLNIFDATYDNAVSKEDAKKFINFNTKESFSITREGEKIAIEKRKDIQETDTIFYAMSRMNELPYRIRFDASNFNPGASAYLEDKFTGLKTLVSTDGVTTYDFNITADALSKAEDRFNVVFKNEFSALPVTFTNVKAWPVNKDIAVQWNITNEVNIKEYHVEKSTDGASFDNIGTTPSQNSGQADKTYQFTDDNAVPGLNYFRIQSVDKDGKTQYSNIVKVNMTSLTGTVQLISNPVTDGVVRVSMANMQKANFNVRLLNSVGQLIKADKLIHHGGSAIHTIKPDQKLAQGIYNLELSSQGSETITLKVIIQ